MSGREYLDDQTKRVLSKTPVSDNEPLTLKDLRYIRMAMIDVSVNHYSIGLQLGVDMSKLDKIRSAHRRDSDRCLTLVIGEWLKNSRNCTWRKVVIAVAAKVGGDNPALATRIARECKNYGSSDSIEGLDRVDSRPLTSASTILVAAALAECPDKWDAVGLFLGIPFKVIEKCRLEDTLEERCMELVNAWIGRKYEMEIFGEPSWRKLVEAIAHKAGGCHKRQALKLADDHPVFNGEPAAEREVSPPPSSPASSGASTSAASTGLARSPTEQLTEADLSTLMNDLTPVAHKWNFICLQLGVPQSTLVNIEAQPMRIAGAPLTFLQDGLFEWLRVGSDSCTITLLCEALTAPSVDEAVLAAKVEESLKRKKGLL